MDTRSAFLVDGIRTPIGSLGGGLSTVRADDLAAHAIRELIKRHPELDWSALDDAYLGCANQAGEDNRNVARMATLLAGLPPSVPAETVNRLCASGLSAVIHAARAVQANEGDLLLAGGVEHMTRAPFALSKPSKAFGGDSQIFDSTFGWRFVNPEMRRLYGTDAMGETAENLADQYQISREDQDALALRSQQRTAAALARGFFAGEIAPVSIPQRKGDPIVFAHDEFAKPGTTLEGLAGLRPAFSPAFSLKGTVTAGNASGLNDGAAALLIASEPGLRQHQLKPLARIVSSGVAGVEPRIMGIGPVPATQLALKRAGLTLADIDHIELNEAFAAQALAVTRALGLDDLDPRINPNGGAISLGHPLGMSGARLALTAARALHETQGRYALVTMCIGVGQGYALVLERA
ncbi:MAG: 3-oxoadipyl-CoA thiolase [Flavobacteriaceae bacterium]|nr:3-oxoadipyl-CoA thiolase [Flavobacteriaceae bacterium]PHX83730.1 MAG: 3-oxoadipyl-CoA thiolase [Flavobacteriales bacterium]